MFHKHKNVNMAELNGYNSKNFPLFGFGGTLTEKTRIFMYMYKAKVLNVTKCSDIMKYRTYAFHIII